MLSAIFASCQRIADLQGYSCYSWINYKSDILRKLNRLLYYVIMILCAFYIVSIQNEDIVTNKSLLLVSTIITMIAETIVTLRLPGDRKTVYYASLIFFADYVIALFDFRMVSYYSYILAVFTIICFYLNTKFIAALSTLTLLVNVINIMVDLNEINRQSESNTVARKKIENGTEHAVGKISHQTELTKEIQQVIGQSVQTAQEVDDTTRDLQ